MSSRAHPLGRRLKVKKITGISGELGIKGEILPENLVAYVPKDKIEFTQKLLKERGSKMEVKSLTELEGDVEFIQEFGGKPSMIESEEIVGSITPERAALVASKNVNQVAEASLEISSETKRRIGSVVFREELDQIDRIVKFVNEENNFK